jgi:hypothetical protein
MIDKLVQLGGFSTSPARRGRRARPRESGQAVRRLVRLILIGVAVKVAKKRLPHAQQAYKKAVAAGARPSRQWAPRSPRSSVSRRAARPTLSEDHLMGIIGFGLAAWAVGLLTEP